MRLGFRFALTTIAAAVVFAAEIQPSGLTVHEWGTFTSVAGVGGAPLSWNALGCGDDLPKFVNDYGYRGFKWTLNATVRMETPVIYFYSSRDVDAQVKVRFPQGLITEWFPRAQAAVYQEGRRRRVAASGIEPQRDRRLDEETHWTDRMEERPGPAWRVREFSY
jgi:hypothetical protein